MPTSSQSPPQARSPAAPPSRLPRARWPALVTVLLLAALVGGATALRVSITHAQPSWDRSSPIGLLKSDPALLYWFTQRLAADAPHADDLAATTAIQWPDAVDARVEFPQLQMQLAAATWRWFGGSTPLHEWCVLLFSLLASTALIGVWGLARELTGSRGLAWAATVAAFLLPATWRTASFVLLGEDVALPALAFHLWLLLRAARMRTAGAFLLAGVPLAIAMAAWHATGFFVAIEAAALFLCTLRSGSNPFAVPRAWLVVAPFAVACLVEPMLRGKLQLLSLPMQLAFALLALAALERRRRLATWARIGAAVGLVALFAALAWLIGNAVGGGIGDYSHVFRLVLHKLLHFGDFPADPNELPFEVRILWQGPFDTTKAKALLLNLSAPLFAALLGVLLALPAWRRGAVSDDETARGDAAGLQAARTRALALAVAAPLFVAALLASWLIQRTLVYAALLAPVVGVAACALLAQRLAPAHRRFALGGMVALLIAPPALQFQEFVRFVEQKNPWYEPRHIAEIRAAVAAVQKLVPAGEAIASDEINSTALLAHTGRSILVQPKYESKAARERLEEYRMAATRGTPEELAEFLRRHRCRFLLYDWFQLFSTRYQAGLRYDVKELDGASALAIAYTAPEQLDGFRLLWRSGGPRDGMRLYVLERP